MYKIDNRPKKHKGRYTILGIVLGISLALAGVYLYDNDKQPILDNVNQVKSFAIKQIPKDSPIISVVNDNPVEKPSVPSQTVDNSQPQNQPVSEPKTIDVNALENAIHQEINNQREQNGLKPLSYDQKLATIARNHSQDMALNNYFDHISPNGKGLLDRYREGQYPCFALSGENIQQNFADQSDLSNSIVDSWMNSPEHRDNLLSDNFYVEGIGVYQQDNNVFITDDFC